MIPLLNPKKHPILFGYIKLELHERTKIYNQKHTSSRFKIYLNEAGTKFWLDYHKIPTHKHFITGETIFIDDKRTI